MNMTIAKMKIDMAEHHEAVDEMVEGHKQEGAPPSEIHKGKKSSPRTVMIYGGPGIGKSTWANDAPRSVFVLTEDGVDDIDCESYPLAKSYDQFDGRLRSLAAGGHTYKTVIIDALTTSSV